MSQPINSVVEITISRAAASVTTASFGTIMLVTESAVLTGRYLEITDPKDLLDAGYTDTSTAYKKASIVLSQSPKVSSMLVGRKDALETFAEALNAIQSANKDWYTLLIGATADADILACGQWVEQASTRKEFYYLTHDPKCVDGEDDTDILSQMKALNYDRSLGNYSPVSGKYLDAAFAGRFKVFAPGTANPKFLDFAGIAVDDIDVATGNILEAKNGNYYTKIGDDPSYSDGWVSSGEYIDIINGIDWIEFRASVDVFSALKVASQTGSKIPYTDKGVVVLESAVSAVLKTAVESQILAEDPAPVVNTRPVSEQDPSDKLVRKYVGLSFDGTLARAVNYVGIKGNLV